MTDLSKKRQVAWFVIIFLTGWFYRDMFKVSINFERIGGEIEVYEAPMPIEETLNVNNPHIVSADAFSVLGD